MNSHGKKLRLKKTRRGYHLHDGKDAIATLDLHTPHASRASVLIGDKRWLLERAKLLERQVRIHEDAPGGDPRLFCANWNCKGALEMGGKPYFWGPVNKLWTQWAWHDAEGNELIRIKTRHNFFDMEGEVKHQNTLSPEEQAYLTLVGWYMLLLHHQEPEALVLTGIQFSLQKLARLIR
jgi:hypothetical protein